MNAPGRACGVEGCNRAPRSSGAELCNTHYFRLRRTGDVGPAEIWDKAKTPCEIPGCERVRCRKEGYCETHYRRIKKHGSPEYVAPTRVGEANGSWSGDAVGYAGAHTRVRSIRGAVTTYTCDHCGGQAKHWAYDHLDPREKLDSRGIPYSTDPDHYLAMCVPCHKRFDLDHIARERA